MFRHSAAALEFMDRLGELQKDQAQWSQATFGTDEERGPLGALAHLEKEAKEAGDEWKKAEANKGKANRYLTAEYQYELADCFLLLLDAIRRSGMGLPELLRAAETKMVINKNRTWPKPTSDAPVEHVKEEDCPICGGSGEMPWTDTPESGPKVCHHPVVQHQPDELDLHCQAIIAALTPLGKDAQDRILILEQVIDYLRQEVEADRETGVEVPYTYPSGFKVGQEVWWNAENVKGVRKYNTHIQFKHHAVLIVQEPPNEGFPPDAVQIREKDWPRGEGAVDSWCLYANNIQAPEPIEPSIKRKPLDNSYTDYCRFCPNRIHKHNALGICPNCVAQGKHLDGEGSRPEPASAPDNA